MILLNSNNTLFYLQSETQHGYIKAISPIKKSKRNFDYYGFQLQVSPTNVRGFLGFNIPSHSKLVDLQESKSPVVLRNLKQGSNQQDLSFNQSSSADVALPVDVDFCFTAIEPPAKDQGPPTISITLGSLQTMKPMQKVLVVATLTFGDVAPKLVMLKKTYKQE